MVRTQWSATVACMALCWFAPVAHAHISLEMATPSTHKSRNGDGSAVLKTGPCGRGSAARGSNIYTYEPGSTIILNVSEYVLHPGYFRIAFSMNGDADFAEPQSIMPMNRACQSGEMRCGKTDFCSNPGVLLDNLDEHWQMDGTPTPNPPPQYSWAVKLPDVECENCTLQVIQIMTDPLGGAHGPYDLAMDIYHQCIDLVLKRGAGGQMNPPPAPKPLKGMDCKAAAPGADSAGSGGAPAAAGTGGTAGATGGIGAGTAGATGTAGSGSVPSGSGGSVASGGSAGTRSTPVDGLGPMTTPVATGGRTAAPPAGGTTAPLPAAPPSGASSGCRIDPTGAGASPWLIAFGALLLGSRRRRRAPAAR